MTTAVHPSVDWIHLTIGDRKIGLEPSTGIELRLIVEPVPDDRAFDVLEVPRPAELRVVVDLIPNLILGGMSALSRCESEAARVAAAVGSGASALAELRKFSLEAALGGEGLPYSRVSVPRLTLEPDSAPYFDEDQPLPGLRVLAATAHAFSGDTKYSLRHAD